jgi:hypothetical protein
MITAAVNGVKERGIPFARPGMFGPASTEPDDSRFRRTLPRRGSSGAEKVLRILTKAVLPYRKIP